MLIIILKQKSGESICNAMRSTAELDSFGDFVRCSEGFERTWKTAPSTEDLCGHLKAREENLFSRGFPEGCRK